jgi:hypothetical protein
MPVSRASSDASSSAIYALVAFIVLFLAAAVFAVIMYMKNEQYVRDAETATTQLKEIASGKELDLVKSLGKGTNRTAIGQIIDDMNALAALVGGDDLGKVTVVDARDRIEQSITPLWPEIETALSGVTEEEFNKSIGLKKVLEMMIDLINAGKEGIKALSDQVTAMLEMNQQQIQERDDHIAELESELEKASLAADTTETTYQQIKQKLTADYEKIIANQNTRFTEMQNKEKSAREEMENLKAQITEFQKEVKVLKDRLQQLSPKPETEMAALEPDGYVVSVVAREDLAYINLAHNDHIYRGLTFSVYDKYQTVPKNGQGKATLEVIEIMDTISKCRITDSEATNPIREGDIIANLVWDQDKKYLFCVAGDFDFDSDGQVDADGRERVEKLIESWGGRVTSTITVDTDFLVIGREPTMPEKAADEFGMTAESTTELRDKQKSVEEYQQVRQDGVALGVPTFNLSRFLYFIGYYQQAKGIR